MLRTFRSAGREALIGYSVLVAGLRVGEKGLTSRAQSAEISGTQSAWRPV